MNKPKKELTYEKSGITLISLVVTIIILLILSGVAINLALGDNGILTRADKAKQESEKAEIIEQIQFDISDKELENLRNINDEEFYEILEKYGVISKDGTTLITNKGNYEILIADIYTGNILSSLITTALTDWKYTISDKNIILNKYIGNDEKIFIPNTFEIEEKIYNTIIGSTLPNNSVENLERPFAFNTNLKAIKFDNNVKSKDKSAAFMFYSCSNLESVYNLPIELTGLNNTFSLCRKLMRAPQIYSGITDMNSAFYTCSSLTNAPQIPETVINMPQTFAYCYNLRQVSKISSSVINMKKTFMECNSLTGILEIESNEVSNVEDCFYTTVKRDNELLIKLNKDTTTYSSFRESINNWDNIYIESDIRFKIACYGDSLTYGTGGMPYTKTIENISKKSILAANLGVGGESSKNIAIRQGGIPIYTNEFIIPSTKEAVEIQINNGDNSIGIALQGTAGLNPCYINGIEGNIKYNSQTKKYEFERIEEGISVKVDSGTRIITKGMSKYKDSTMVIWAGTNDIPDSSTVENVIKNIDLMIEYNDSSNYIVVGLTSKSHIPDVIEVNEALSQKYREHFLDIRKYILESGLTDLNISPTAQDLEDLSNGEIPTSLRSDNVHFNTNGYTIIGTQIYNKLLSLGYISE